MNYHMLMPSETQIYLGGMETYLIPAALASDDLWFFIFSGPGRNFELNGSSVWEKADRHVNLYIVRPIDLINDQDQFL